MDNTEVYSRGGRRFEAAPAHHAEIYDMKEKPGYIAKEIEVTQDVVAAKGGWANVKKEVELASQVLDSHIKDHLPNYFFTFIDGPPANKIVFFMEEVAPNNKNGNRFPAGQLDTMIENVGRMYNSTYDQNMEQGTAPDLEVRNLVYGTTVSNPDPKLYLVDLYPLFKKTPKQMQGLVSSLLKGYFGEVTNITPKAAEFLEKLNEK